MPRIASVTIAADPVRWREAGFLVDADGSCRIGSVRLRLVPDVDGRRGVRSWAVAGLSGGGDGSDEIDGLPTERVSGDDAGGQPAEHPNGSIVIDHLVVTTPDVDRTVRVLESEGLEPRRTRDSDTYGAPMRQVFFRMGEVILEVVGPPERVGDGRARFFGVAVTVADLDAAKAQLGGDLGEPKDAVQPGRRIATVRKTAGLGAAVALMSEGSQEYG